MTLFHMLLIFSVVVLHCYFKHLWDPWISLKYSSDLIKFSLILTLVSDNAKKKTQNGYFLQSKRYILSLSPDFSHTFYLCLIHGNIFFSTEYSKLVSSSSLPCWKKKIPKLLSCCCFTGHLVQDWPSIQFVLPFVSLVL